MRPSLVFHHASSYHAYTLHMAFVHTLSSVFSTDGEPPKTLEWQEVNLAAELVGYGSEAGAGYWILRVPWGVGWGEGGYMRVLRSEAAIFDAVAIDPMV